MFWQTFLPVMFPWKVATLVLMETWKLKNLINYLKCTIWQVKAGENLSTGSKLRQSGLNSTTNLLPFLKKVNFFVFCNLFVCIFGEKMSSKIIDVFNEYSYLCKKRKFTLAGDTQNWNWFKIYVFSKEDLDLVEELKRLNSLLVSHNMHEFGEGVQFWDLE